MNPTGEGGDVKIIWQKRRELRPGNCNGECFHSNRESEKWATASRQGEKGGPGRPLIKGAATLKIGTKASNRNSTWDHLRSPAKGAD